MTAVAEQQVPVTGALIYTAEQASRRLGVDEDGRPIRSARWLLEMARAGRIPRTYLGRKPCWSEQNLRDLVAQGHCDPENARKAA